MGSRAPKQPPRSGKGWIGVDFDGTLCVHVHGSGSPHVIGPPVPAMVERVHGWRATGIEVRIVTARVCRNQDAAFRHDNIRSIHAWCFHHLGFVLRVTAEKDFDMLELWDDRAVAVERDTGKRL